MEASYPASIVTAIHAVMQEVGYVQKKGRNDFHKYRYAGEADLLQALRPAMLKHGLVLIPSSRITGSDGFGNTHVEVSYTLAHTDGSVWPRQITAAGSGNDKNSKGGVGDKGVYKAITGANKYLLFKLFQIESGDDPEVASDGDKGGRPDDVAVPDEYQILYDTIKQDVLKCPDLKDLKSVWGGYASDLGDIKVSYPALYTKLEEAKDGMKERLSKKEAA